LIEPKCFFLQDIIANVPPHWRKGVVEDHGSRWSGQVRGKPLVFTRKKKMMILFL
jgi:hypothetical protein